ncbi:MAG: hypothetical protein ACKOCY_07575 [Actinomycetota bacterium]
MRKHNLSSVVVGRDARYGSKDFAQDTAEIMQGAGMKVYLLPSKKLCERYLELLAHLFQELLLSVPYLNRFL